MLKVLLTQAFQNVKHDFTGDPRRVHKATIVFEETGNKVAVLHFTAYVLMYLFHALVANYYDTYSDQMRGFFEDVYQTWRKTIRPMIMANTKVCLFLKS